MDSDLVTELSSPFQLSTFGIWLDNDLMMQEKLLETLLKGKASLEAVRHLSSPNINDSSNGTIIEDENWTKWKLQLGGEGIPKFEIFVCF